MSSKSASLVVSAPVQSAPIAPATPKGTDVTAVLAFCKSQKRHPKTAEKSFPSKVASALNRQCKGADGIYTGPMSNGGQFWTGPEITAFCATQGVTLGA